MTSRMYAKPTRLIVVLLIVFGMTAMLALDGAQPHSWPIVLVVAAIILLIASPFYLNWITRSETEVSVISGYSVHRIAWNDITRIYIRTRQGPARRPPTRTLVLAGQKGPDKGAIEIRIDLYRASDLRDLIEFVAMRANLDISQLELP